MKTIVFCAVFFSFHRSRANQKQQNNNKVYLNYKIKLSQIKQERN